MKCKVGHDPVPQPNYALDIIEKMTKPEVARPTLLIDQTSLYSPETIALARVLFEAMRGADATAFVQGDPIVKSTIIDGRFDLRAVAREIELFVAKSNSSRLKS